MVHPAAPTEPRPASHPVIGRTVGDPLARRGHFAHRLRADGAHTPWTSPHVSVVSLLQAMLAEHIAPLVGPKGHHNPRPDSTAARHSEAGRGDPGRPPGADPRTLVRFGSVPPWSSGIPAGTSGHDEYNETTGHRTFTPEPRPLEHGRRGFEYHLMAAAGRRPLPTRLVSPGRASPLARAGPVATRSELRSSSPAVPSPCHSEHDASGSPRSATDTADRLTSAPCITDTRQHEW